VLPELQCPACGGSLSRRRCDDCGADYPLVRGVPTFLTPDAAPDNWAEAESGLARALRESPELERALLGPPIEELAPADRMFRSFVLDERGDYDAARAAEASAWPELYTPEMLDCNEQAFSALLERLGGQVVDLASGRCMLVERMEVPVVATDVSPHVLARAQERGVASEVLAFDARRTPFRDGAVETMTTFLGLANVEQPGELLRELRRVARRLLAIHQLYPEGDANAKAIKAFGMERLAYREPFLEELAGAGWDAEIVFECRAQALPTPAGVVLEGARIDGLPVAPTEIDWIVLEAH
jgi:methyltransferase family protein